MGEKIAFDEFYAWRLSNLLVRLLVKRLETIALRPHNSENTPIPREGPWWQFLLLPTTLTTSQLLLINVPMVELIKGSLTRFPMKHTMKHSLFQAKASCLVGLLSLVSSSLSSAQLAASGTPGDRAVYSLPAGKLGVIDDVRALPSATLTWDFDDSSSILTDNSDSFALGAEGGDDETKVFLTAGHHLVMHGGRWDAVDERSTPVNYLKINGAAVPYGVASGYTRDINTTETVVRGGTIINVSQGDYLEVESLRTDIYQADENRPMTQVDGDLQLLKLDDAGLDFLRLSRSSSTTVMPGGNEGPTAISYEVQDEISASSFDHSISANPEQITLKGTGHYLVFANTGFSIAPTSQRNAITQTLKLNGAAIDGGATQVYLRNSNANDGIGGLSSQGAVSVGVIVEVTSPDSVLTVEVTRDNNNSASAVSVDHTRTGLAIAKLPTYGEFITLNGASQGVNSSAATARDFSASSDVSNASFSYTSGTSASQVVVNKTDDVLFLSSFFAASAPTTRGVVRQGFSTTSGGPVSYGASSSYARNQAFTAPDGAQAVGNWSGAILSGLSIGDGVEVTTEQFGVAGTVNAVPSIQALNIASISMPPPVPVIAVNNTVGLSTNEATYTIANTDLGTTDSDNTPAELTYTIDSQPSGGVLQLSGVTLNNGDTFSQDDIDNGLLTFEVGASETDSGGFDFTVRDLGLNAESGTFVVRVALAIALTGDAVATDEDTITTQAQLTVGANLLSNDTGSGLTVTSFDSTSALGAPVTVNSDGTFSYDPTGIVLFQQTSSGDSSSDSFDYTVTDTIGKTATATVTLTVAGLNDAPEAMPDVLNNGPLENASSFVSTRDLTANDGSYRDQLIDLTFPPGSDLRLLPGKVVSQSPSVGTPPGNGFPENAFDGNLGTFTHTQSNNNTVDHSWEVDFGQDVSLESLTMTNRQDCCGERLRDITVRVFDALDAEIFESTVLNPGNAEGFTGNSGGTLFVDFGGPLTGRRIVITRDTDEADLNAGNGSILTLSEVTVIGSAPGSYPVDDLLLNYDAANSAGSGRWENQGTSGGTNADWLLQGVTLDSSPVTARAQITAAYEWDSIEDIASMPNGGSIQNNLSGAEDAQDATWEFWVKPANTTSVMTLFESGGGTGFGMIINNGVLEAATELDGGPKTGSYVSYDLVADPLNLVGGDPTTEFNQYVVAIDIGGGGIALYVNGVKVDETTSGTGNDWDGGDAAGLGIFRGSNHGGFTNGAAATAYNAPFLGQMAIVRLYSGLLTPRLVHQNFKAVDGDTDIEGDTITTAGVIDADGNLVEIGTEATLSSGALVTMTNNTGSFDYKPNGAFSLAPGQTVFDTFTYQITDGNGGTAISEVKVTITGIANPIDDDVLAKNGKVVTYTPNELLRNDEFVATPGAYIDLPSYGLSGGTWTNVGSGVGFNGTIVGSIVNAPDLTSGFQMIGAGSTGTNLGTLDPISTGDATLELWFKPDAGQTGKSTLFETGGNGNGFSIVFDADTNEVTANVDGGDDATASIVVTAGGILTSEFNQLIVVIQPNAGDEVAGSPLVFEDLLTVYVNNDPLAGFDATVDGSGVNAAGLANDWAGTDLGGLNATQGTTALNENFPATAGQIAAFRVYDRVLTPTEMAANFDSASNAITGVSSQTTGEGAAVTLNADGTVSVDYTGTSLATGASLSDSFTYTTSGGTGSVNVTIQGNTIQEDWRLANYGSIDNTGDGADAAVAANGLSNLVNFAADLDPNETQGTLDVNGVAGTITTLGPPQVWTDPADGKIYFRYTRRTDFAAIPLTLTEQFSPNVEDYEDNTAAPIVVATGTGASGAAIEAVVVEFPLILPASGRKARFARLQVVAE